MDSGSSPENPVEQQEALQLVYVTVPSGGEVAETTQVVAVAPLLSAVTTTNDGNEMASHVDSPILPPNGNAVGQTGTADLQGTAEQPATPAPSDDTKESTEGATTATDAATATTRATKPLEEETLVNMQSALAPVIPPANEKRYVLAT